MLLVAVAPEQGHELPRPPASERKWPASLPRSPGVSRGGDREKRPGLWLSTPYRVVRRTHSFFRTRTDYAQDDEARAGASALSSSPVENSI